VVWVAFAYLTFAFLFVAPWTQIPGLEQARIFAPDMLGNIDKTYLSLWRVANVVALGYLVLILLSPQSEWLTRPLARLVADCGRYSLQIFCLGTMLSFVGWVILVETGYGLGLQILVNLFGIGILLGMAWVFATRSRGAEWAFAHSLRKLFAERRGVPQLPASQ
ncbi:OpgC domain-containing protein, partial [Microbacteriaceae bacterium K1510]|nr:OpgC domain-containing protein [Microbacteriaceae bacterium K1510]